MEFFMCRRPLGFSGEFAGTAKCRKNGNRTGQKNRTKTNRGLRARKKCIDPKTDTKPFPFCRKNIKIEPQNLENEFSQMKKFKKYNLKAKSYPFYYQNETL